METHQGHYTCVTHSKRWVGYGEVTTLGALYDDPNQNILTRSRCFKIALPRYSPGLVSVAQSELGHDEVIYLSKGFFRLKLSFVGKVSRC
jgi:hypothetical protein